MPYALLNRQVVAATDAALPACDIAIGRGYAVFDFFRTARGRALFLEAHLDRLEHSCREMRLELPFTRGELEALLAELMDRNRMPDSGIRITVTGGEPADGYSVSTPNVLITQQPLAVPDDPSPVRLVTYDHRRQLPHVKTIDYLMAVWLRPWIAAQGADDVLYHTGGVLTECPRSSIFLVTADDALVTPASGILPGITRRRVLEAARPHLPVVERALGLEELRGAREVFITSTSRQIVPVSAVDGHPLPASPGDITRRLARCASGTAGAHRGG